MTHTYIYAHGNQREGQSLSLATEQQTRAGNQREGGHTTSLSGLYILGLSDREAVSPSGPCHFCKKDGQHCYYFLFTLHLSNHARTQGIAVLPPAGLHSFASGRASQGTVMAHELQVPTLRQHCFTWHLPVRMRNALSS